MLGNYQQIISLKRVDMCKLFTKEYNDDQFKIKFFFDSVNYLTNNSFHVCPYKDYFEIKNMTCPTEYAMDWPKGDFIIKIKVFDNIDLEAANIKVYLRVKARDGFEI